MTRPAFCFQHLTHHDHTHTGLRRLVHLGERLVIARSMDGYTQPVVPMKQKLDPDLVTEIVEDDPVASAQIRRLFEQWRAGVITEQRLGRLRSNAIGNALSRWREQQKCTNHDSHAVCA